MKLACEDLSRPVAFGENSAAVIALEAPAFFRNFVQDLLRQHQTDEGKFVLSDGGEILPLSKNAEIILQPFGLNMNRRKVLTMLYRELAKLASGENFFVKTLELRAAVCAYLSDIAFGTEHKVDFNADFPVEALFGAAEMRFASESGGVLDNLVDYCRLCRVFLRLPLVILAGMGEYFGEEELIGFYRQMEYEKINVLLIERRYAKKLYHEKLYVIDRDLCEVYCDF